MDGVNVRDFSGADDCRDVEVAVVETWRANADGFVGEPDMQRVTVGFAVYRDRLDAQLLAGANHPQGDFPSVRNEDCLLYTSPSPRDGLLSRMPSSA